MIRKNIVPLRGVGVDWSGDKEKEQLRENQYHARLLIENQLQGCPEFDEYASFLCLPNTEKVTRTMKRSKGAKNKK
jgi:hypothetical protein